MIASWWAPSQVPRKPISLSLTRLLIVHDLLLSLAALPARFETFGQFDLGWYESSGVDGRQAQSRTDQAYFVDVWQTGCRLADRMWRTVNAQTTPNKEQHKPVCAPGASQPELLDRFRQDLIRSRLGTPSPAVLYRHVSLKICRRQHLDTNQCTDSTDTSLTSLGTEPVISSRYV